MKMMHTGDPRVLELRSNVLGCVVVVGLLFIACGLVGIGFALEVIPVEAFIEPGMRPIVLAFGFIGILLGLVFVGGRSGKRVDGRSQVMASWSGLWVPMWRSEQSLVGFSKVLLAKEVRRGQKTTRTVFPVSLEGDRDPALRIQSCSQYLDARRLAEAFAKALHRPLTDSTSGEDVVRGADRLDESLRERMRRIGERIEVSPRPADMRSQAQVTSSEVTVDFPGMSPKARLVMNLVVIGIAVSIGLLFFGGPVVMRIKGPWVLDVVTLLAPILFVGAPLAIVLNKLRRFNRPVHVAANRAALTIVEGQRTTEIPGDELEELSISGKDFSQLFVVEPDGTMVVDPSYLDTAEGAAHLRDHGRSPASPPALVGVVRTLGSLSPERLSILARSDRESVVFGGGLDTAELSYVYSAILKAMVD